MRVNAAAAHLIEGARCERQPPSARRRRLVLGLDTLLEAEIDQPPLATQRAGLQPASATACRRRSIRASTHQPGLVAARGADGTTTLRWQRKLAGGWKFVAHAATQQLSSDDRIGSLRLSTRTHPTAPTTPTATARNGNFDLLTTPQRRRERRRSDALDLNLSGRLHTGAIEHAVSAGILSSCVEEPLRSANLRLSGIGNVDGIIK